MAAAEREALQGAAFDRLGLKEKIWNAHKDGTGTVRVQAYSLGDLARVLCFLPRGHAPPPLAFWAKIFQWFGPAPDGRPWHVTWFAAQTPRQFPSAGQDLGPEHVNGGYTHSCSTHGIFIYRSEEATRVLIHEMMHAACLDEKDWPIPMREAMVETWAELILIALLSGGSPTRAAHLWKIQSHWVADTNWRARHANNTEDMSDYAWRYLCGREDMYAYLGISLPAPRPDAAHASQSLRFTSPDLEPPPQAAR